MSKESQVIGNMVPDNKVMRSTVSKEEEMISMSKALVNYSQPIE